jgi:hypothetical protein
MAEVCGNYLKAFEHIYTGIGIELNGANNLKRLAALWNIAGQMFARLKW